jgi:hypothetical protein
MNGGGGYAGPGPVGVVPGLEVSGAVFVSPSSPEDEARLRRIKPTMTKAAATAMVPPSKNPPQLKLRLGGPGGGGGGGPLLLGGRDGGDPRPLSS